MRKLSKVINKKEDSIVYQEDSSVVLACLVGIELEIENISIDDVLTAVSKDSLWKATGDGSLRNNGVELVSVPVSGVNLVNAIDSLEKILTNGAPNAEITERCSMHVHIDMRDISVRQLLNFLIVYTIFEDELFKYVGYKRKENPYCVPLVDSYTLQDLMERLTGTDRQVERLIRDWPKYSAVNLRSLIRLGTVEIRMHPGTLDPKEVFSWVNILLSIKKYVVDNPRRNTQSIIDSVCKDPEGLINNVFAGIFLEKLDLDTVDSMLEGARVAQQVYRYRNLTDAPIEEVIERLPVRIPRPRVLGMEELTAAFAATTTTR